MDKLYDTTGQEADLLISDLEERGAEAVVPYLTDRVSDDTTEEVSSAPDLPHSDSAGDLTAYWGEGRVVLVRDA